MSLMDVSPVVSYRQYLTALSDARIALDVMRSLPPELEQSRELAQALERVIDAIRVFNGPDQDDVDELRDLLDLMETFPSNDQRARFLLSSNWMQDRHPPVKRLSVIDLLDAIAAGGQS